MKRAKLLEILKDAKKNAELKTACFDIIGKPRKVPVTFADGRTVTEDNVNEFIKERVQIHHHSWIINPLEDAIRMVKAGMQHPYEPWHVGRIYGSMCNLCGKWPDYRLHKKVALPDND